MAERLHQETWEKRWRRVRALLITADVNQQQHDPPQLDNILNPQLFSVAKKGDVEKFIKALEDQYNQEGVSLPVLLEQRSPSKNTLLHAAAESDDNIEAVIDFVPEHLISCKNSRGEMPLHIAARTGKARAVELLLRQGMPGDTDRCGNSALHEAVRNHHCNVIAQLVTKDPNMLYCQNNESKSPLCVAVETGDPRVLTCLLDAPNNGEDQRRSQSDGIFCMSPVHLAIICEEKEMLTIMKEKKPSLFQLRDPGDGTPLHLAAYTNYLHGVKFLIENFPASALEQDTTGYLPIHVACMMGHTRIVKKLLQQWSDPAQQWSDPAQQWSDPAEFLTRLGQNILHVSARYGCIATVRYILKNPTFGHLINTRDFNGNTPLHLAALHCQPSVVQLARDKRVNLGLINNNNMTALNVVEQDIQVVGAPLRKRLTKIILLSVNTPRKRELAICKSTGRSRRKRLGPPKSDEVKDRVDSRMLVAALMASVTFTSGFSVPGGYNSSNPDAGIPILLHKAMYRVFVISNSVAMYSSIMALVTLFWTNINDPYLMVAALSLSNLALLVALAAMPLAFTAGVYVTVHKVAGLSTFVLVFGSFALFIILYIFILLYFPLSCRLPLIRAFSHRIIFRGLVIARREAAGSETPEPAATSVQGTRDNNLRPHLKRSFSESVPERWRLIQP